MSTLAEYVQSNPDEYDVRDGIIRSPGKFEGEPLYVPYFHAQACEGFADETYTSADGSAHDAFILTAEDRAACEGLAEVYAVVIHETDSGFVDSECFINANALATYQYDVEGSIVEEEEEAEGPSPEDYVIRCDGNRYHVGIIEGAHVGTFGLEEDAEQAVRKHRATTSPNFWPNVWRESDHGNQSIAEGWRWDPNVACDTCGKERDGDATDTYLIAHGRHETCQRAHAQAHRAIALLDRQNAAETGDDREDEAAGHWNEKPEPIVSEPEPDMSPSAVQARQNAHVLDLIADAMHGKEWTSDTLDYVARIVRLTGRTIGDAQ